MDVNTIFYAQNAQAFFDTTAGVDMSALYQKFLSRLPVGSCLLDAGCGSGRDAKAFLGMGYRVTAFDSSAELASLAAVHCGRPVEVRSFADVEEVAIYDGIWCSASLLHVSHDELPQTLQRLWRALRPGGCIYLSFKLGKGERTEGGRKFTDADEDDIRSWVTQLSDLHSIEVWITDDRRPERSEKWINAIVARNRTEAKLITGRRDHFLPHLSKAIAHASEIDIAVAFIKTTGLRLLIPDLLSAATVVTSDAVGSVRKIRLLTSDYLDVTDPDALRLLLLLKQRGARVRIYNSSGGSFHLKAYIFSTVRGDSLVAGTAFIGSSNISRQALQEGLEWNYRVVYPGDAGFLEARSRFDDLFDDPNSVELTDAWIENYERRRVPLLRGIAPGSQEQEPPPEATSIQREALVALRASRDGGFRRGLVVLATGLGKTWLAAFDSVAMGARRVLFVAHREEILTQAAQTFMRVRPTSRVGLYVGQSRDGEVDVLCASIQTLARAAHLERFAPQHFDYIVVDEFHHAAAATYRRLLSHFAPNFLLGLTATPDRTDQSDILSLCDDNLVYSCDLFRGITSRLLSPFHYFGITDESVDYREVPWRNGRFDPEELSNKLATLARARHAIKEWRDRAQKKTLAFCASVKHAEFMSEQFNRAGIPAGAVYSGSHLGRVEALERLDDGRLAALFSVDLFNEGVDLPSIDTVMMLRPTESKILFLQQLGRGLRRTPDKNHLVVLDFIGNHVSFLQKPQALFGVGGTYRALAEFARSVQEDRLELPPGCYVNYDLRIIEFLRALDSSGSEKEYEALKASLGRRPSLAEFYRSGASVQTARQRFGSWFDLAKAMGDLDASEDRALAKQGDLLREVEVAAMTKSFKVVLLEALLELDGLRSAPTLNALSQKSWDVLQRRHSLLSDVQQEVLDRADGTSEEWRQYWRKNPIKAWTGGNRPGVAGFFRVDGDTFTLQAPVEGKDVQALSAMLQELVDYKLAAYEVRKPAVEANSNVLEFKPKPRAAVELPYFPNLKIACGHFRTGRTDSEEHRSLSASYGSLDSARHFIARASGDSMNGGKNPIRDGDYLLLELISPTKAGSITGTTMAIERQDEATGESQYLLRVVTKTPSGQYVLKANNSEYPDLSATDAMRTLARLKCVVDPLDLALGQSFQREEIPPLFGETFNPGNWNVGHVVLNEKKAHVLLVTLNKQGKAEEHRYHDHWIDDHTFHWQSQNAVSPTSKRGQELIQHAARGMAIHLFVRGGKLSGQKAAPFVYCGKATYVSHIGSNPMSVKFAVEN
jgi:superfamily II DNA or RNA helicase/HKD family nuclease